MPLPHNIDVLLATNSPDLRSVDKGELAIYLLQKLTPSGSEFYNDPIACYNHVQRRFEDHYTSIINLHKRLKNETVR